MKPNYEEHAPKSPYKCQKCRKTTHLSEWDIWGKIIRCVHCTAILMDNRDTAPPDEKLSPEELADVMARAAKIPSHMDRAIITMSQERMIEVISEAGRFFESPTAKKVPTRADLYLFIATLMVSLEIMDDRPTAEVELNLKEFALAARKALKFNPKE